MDRARQLFRTGRVAVHINCAGDGLAATMFGTESDPYSLAKAWGTPLPVGGLASKMMIGLPIGQRQLAALAVAAGKELGVEGKLQLRVVLTVSEAEAELVFRDLQERRFYGFSPARIFMLVQPALPGHLWDVGTDAWVEIDGAPQKQTYGAGYAIKQMGWAGEAFGFAVTAQGIGMLPSAEISQKKCQNQ